MILVVVLSLTRLVNPGDMVCGLLAVIFSLGREDMALFIIHDARSILRISIISN